MRISVKARQEVSTPNSKITSLFKKAVPLLTVALGLSACASPPFNPYAPNTGPNDPNPLVDSCRYSNGVASYLLKNGDTVTIQDGDADSEWGPTAYANVNVVIGGQSVEVDFQEGKVSIAPPEYTDLPTVGRPLSQSDLENEALDIASRYKIYTDYVLDKGYAFPHPCESPGKPNAGYLAVPMTIPGIN